MRKFLEDYEAQFHKPFDVISGGGENITKVLYKNSILWPNGRMFWF